MTDSIHSANLLGRDLKKTSLQQSQMFESTVVAVTGAGGSLGGEICRQLAVLHPKLLLLIDHDEHRLFSLAADLNDCLRFDSFRIVLADAADQVRMQQAFDAHPPDIVIHAAAHKHVPIVQENIAEAARTNVLGTYVTANCATQSGAQKVLLLSTDKAVYPRSVLGLTKHAAEMICAAFAGTASTQFVTVRFGNVLDSSGGVLEVFNRRLELGLPLTVTDNGMERYFTTLQEAASWLLRALERGGNRVFVMDMGEPVQIVALADRLLALRGYGGAATVETGARPGEKLIEELLTRDERAAANYEERSFVFKQPAISFDRMAGIMAELQLSLANGRDGEVLDALTRIAAVTAQVAAAR